MGNYSDGPRPNLKLGPLSNLGQVIRALGKTIRAMADGSIDTQAGAAFVTGSASCGLVWRRQSSSGSKRGSRWQCGDLLLASASSTTTCGRCNERRAEICYKR
jgi:hypothetical protein